MTPTSLKMMLLLLILILILPLMSMGQNCSPCCCEYYPECCKENEEFAEEASTKSSSDEKRAPGLRARRLLEIQLGEGERNVQTETISARKEKKGLPATPSSPNPSRGPVLSTDSSLQQPSQIPTPQKSFPIAANTR